MLLPRHGSVRITEDELRCYATEDAAATDDDSGGTCGGVVLPTSFPSDDGIVSE